MSDDNTIGIWADVNAMNVARVTWHSEEPTNHLRWDEGVLKQLWVIHSSESQCREWREIQQMEKPE